MLIYKNIRPAAIGAGFPFGNYVLLAITNNFMDIHSCSLLWFDWSRIGYPKTPSRDWVSVSNRGLLLILLPWTFVEWVKLGNLGSFVSWYVKALCLYTHALTPTNVYAHTYIHAQTVTLTHTTGTKLERGYIYRGDSTQLGFIYCKIFVEQT